MGKLPIETITQPGGCEMRDLKNYLVEMTKNDDELLFLRVILNDLRNNPYPSNCTNYLSPEPDQVSRLIYNPSGLQFRKS